MIRVVDLRNPSDGRGRDWWAAWCSVCGRYVTKYAYSAAQARAEALEDGHEHAARGGGG